ncbi:MAG: hypothetical protein ACW986_16170 [Promethearchaeota archaeon]|jgi:hypothetical protein
MIEEEDDEDILKKKITAKTVAKNLLLILPIIFGALLVYLPILPSQYSMWSWSIGFLLICIGVTFLQMQKNTAEPIRQTLTILICNLCGLTKVRNYERGDFIFRKFGKCDKCEDVMEIKQIYSVKLKKPTEPNKPEDKESKKKSKD